MLDSADNHGPEMQFRMSRLTVLAVGLWLLGEMFLYICSWAACESMIPDLSTTT